MRIYDFKTNYMHNPIAVDASPVFCWKTDFEQSKYHLIVKNNGQTVYDSGEVKSEETVGVRYSGRNLNSDSHYDVFLTSYDKSNRRVEASAYFETGLLNASDWKGIWVNLPANFVGASLLIRRDISVDKSIRSAKCFVAGLGYHELYINGEKTEKVLLAPAFSDPGKRVQYMTYNIAPYLIKGKNTLGIMLGNGWMGQKLLLCQLNILFEDGETYELHTGEGAWWARGGAIVENSVYGGEIYDATKEFALWASPQSSPSWESGWMYLLRALNPPAGMLVSHFVNDIENCGEYIPIAVTQLKNGQTVYDFGQNISGWCRIRVVGSAGSKVILRYGEDVKEDGSVNRINLRLADCRDIYIAKGEGIEEYAPRFTYHGFRYVQAECDKDIKITQIVAEHIHTNVRKSGSFVCSSDVLNRLHKMAVMTELNNLHGIMTDCPQRDERFMWLNDLSSRIFESVNNFGMERVFPKVLDDITDTVDESGRIADTAPYFTAQRPADPVCVCYLLFALRCYEWFGDIASVKKHYSYLKRWTDFLISQSEDFIMNYYYYGDWVLPFKQDEKQIDNLFVSSAYLFWHIKSMKKLSRICREKEDYAYYSDAEARARASLNNRYYHKKEKYYVGNTQTANAIALSLHIAPEEDRKAIAKQIIRDIKARNYHSSCGNQGYRHLFWAMSDMGYIDDLITMIENPEYPGWGYMVKSGATTVWERWEKEMQCEMHSFDHPMFSAYDGWFYEYLGGIKLADDAFGANKVIIAPHLAKSLSFVKCAVDTLHGKVVSEWVKKKDCVEYHVEIPYGVTAELKLPGIAACTAKHGSYDFKCCDVDEFFEKMQDDQSGMVS